MIFDEGDFVRTLWYGRNRIWQKARKYRHFGGFERNYLWLIILTRVFNRNIGYFAAHRNFFFAVTRYFKPFADYRKFLFRG